MSAAFDRSMFFCDSFFFFTRVCAKNSMTNAALSKSQCARKNVSFANPPRSFVPFSSRAHARNTTPTFKPCCRTCFRNTYCVFFIRYRARTLRLEVEEVPASFL